MLSLNTYAEKDARFAAKFAATRQAMQEDHERFARAAAERRRQREAGLPNWWKVGLA